MTPSTRWNLPLVAGLAVLSLAAAVAGLLALSGAPSPIDLADTHDRRAFALLNQSTSPQSMAKAEAELHRALRLSPYNNSARLRLAYIDTVRRGAIGPKGMALLAQSYDLVPLDHTVAAWRVKFALEHWRQLTPAIRNAVGKEVMAFGSTGSKDADIRAVLFTIQNPEGRLAAALWRSALAY